MLKRFSVTNYKNFRDKISINFEHIAGYPFSADCITEGLIGKMLIYGRNATGKTNLGRALMDISYIIFSDPRYPILDSGVFLNADSTENIAKFSYVFQFDDREVIYQYTRFSSQELHNEELIVDGRKVFLCNFTDKEYDFNHLNYIDAETMNVDRYLQSLAVGEEAEEMVGNRLPFLRWILNNSVFNNDSVLLRLSSYISRMAFVTVGGTISYRLRKKNDVFYQSLENAEKLQDLEEFLNAMGIECKLILKQLPDGQRELYFAHNQFVPFYENASSGTLALVDLYRRLISKIWKSSLIYLDEFDAFYHYEMAENVIIFLKKRYPRCQIIMTSHNTNLMTNRLMRPDCMFILSKTGTLTALCDATQRELREGHNLEKMYISGEFEKYE